MRGFASLSNEPADAAERSDVKDGSPGQQPAGGEHAFDIATRAGGVGAAPTSGGPFGSIVEDGAEPGPGQMRRTDFVARAVPAIEATATSELARFGKTAKDCPYLEYYVRYYRDKPAAHIERMIARYAQPEQTDAPLLLDAMLDRVRKAISIWAVTNRNVWPEPGELPSAAYAGGPAAMAKGRLGAGQPLDSTVAARAGDAYGGSFAGVRVHTGPQAARLTAEEGASAVTVGSDIAFAPDQYLPNTPVGDALLAHELAHVKQQGGDSGSVTTGNDAGDSAAHEADADRAAIGFVAPMYAGARGLARRAGPALRSGLALQRCKDPARAASGTEAEALKKELGIYIYTTPEVGGANKAYVGGQVTFGIDFATPPTNHKVQATSWALDNPGSQHGFSQVPVGPTTELPITQVGPHRFHATIEVDDEVTFEIEHKFDAVLPVTKTDELLLQQQGVSLTEFQSQLALQKALLSPPGPEEQGRGAPLRITTAATNPARQKDKDPDSLSYGIEDRDGGTAPRYHWYLKPFRWDGLPATLDGHGKVKLDTGDAYDLGTAATAAFPASHQGTVLVVCRAEGADGKPRGDARYLQAVLGTKEAEGVEKLVEHEKRVAEMSRRFEGPTVPVLGSHVAVQTRGETTLRLYLGRAKGDPQKWLLIDMSLGLDPKQNELEYDAGSVSGVLDDFEEDNRYPLGAISLRIDANSIGVAPTSRRFDTDGKTFLNTLSSKAGLLSLILGLGAVLAAPFTGGGSIVVTMLIIGSAAAAATAGTLSLIDHLKTEEVSKTAIALDILTIVTSFLNAGLAVKALRGGPAVILASTGGRFLLWTNFALEGVSAILVGVEGAEQIIKIIESDAPADEKMRLLVAVVANMILTGTLMVVSYGDIKATRSRLRTHLGGVADDLQDADRLTLALLDDHTLQALKKSDASQLNRLADVLRDDPSALARLVGRSDLLDALKTARGNKALDLEIAFVELGLQQKGIAQNPKLVDLMSKNDGLKNVLAKRPEVMEALLKKPESIDVVERAVASAAAPKTGTTAPATKVITPLSQNQLDLSKRVEGTIPKGKANQPDFDSTKLGDKAYTEKYLDDLYKDAVPAQKELTGVTEEIAGATKGQASSRKDPKDRQRSMDKISSKYGGDASRLTDLAGTKIVYKTLDDLYAGLAQAEKKFAGRIVSFEDRFIAPLPSGYRDIQMNVRMKNGHIAEFRLHLESIDTAAAVEHAAYQVRRAIEPVATAAGRKKTAAEDALEQALGKESQLLYDEALAKARGSQQ